MPLMTHLSFCQIVLLSLIRKAVKKYVPCGQESYRTLQATNRREGGLTSCHTHSRRLCAFILKELETMRVAQILLVCQLLAGAGSAWAGGVGGES
jgi:hypothetical protein